MIKNQNAYAELEKITTNVEDGLGDLKFALDPGTEADVSLLRAKEASDKLRNAINLLSAIVENGGLVTYDSSLNKMPWRQAVALLKPHDRVYVTLLELEMCSQNNPNGADGSQLRGYPPLETIEDFGRIPMSYIRRIVDRFGPVSEKEVRSFFLKCGIVLIEN